MHFPHLNFLFPTQRLAWGNLLIKRPKQFDLFLLFFEADEDEVDAVDDSAVSAVALLRTERSLLPLTALLTLLLRYTEERAVAPRGPGLSYVIEESEKMNES